MIIMMTIMISTTIFQNVTHNFDGVIAAQGVISHPRVRKGVIKLQQIISKHKHIFQL